MKGRVTIAVIVSGCLVVLLGGLFLVGFLRGVAYAQEGVSSKPYTGKPLPCGPNARLGSAVEPSYTAFVRRFTAEAYQQRGKHDPSWDAPAEKFLEAYALRTSGADDPPDAKKLDVMAEDLLAKHCDDPLILERIGTLKLDMKEPAEAEKLISESIAGLQARGYPPLGLAKAYLELAQLNGETGSKPTCKAFKWGPLAVNAFADAADGANFGPEQQRYMWAVFSEILRTWFPGHQAQFAQALKERPKTDPWLLNMAWGLYRNDYAWSRRGQGWASGVSEEDWRAFDAASREAYNYFLAAYQAHPEYPESCYRLMNIASSASLRSGGSERDWFDRGVAAQFDYMPLYSEMVYVLTPRWGGSHEAMLAFGKECLDTGRFDTHVPAVYEEAVKMIATFDLDTAIYRQPDVWPCFQRQFNGYLDYAVKNEPEAVKGLRKSWAQLAQQAGHPEEAQKQWAIINSGGERPTTPTR